MYICTFMLWMTDTITSQIIDFFFSDILYIHSKLIILHISALKMVASVLTSLTSTTTTCNNTRTSLTSKPSQLPHNIETLSLPRRRFGHSAKRQYCFPEADYKCVVDNVLSYRKLLKGNAEWPPSGCEHRTSEQLHRIPARFKLFSFQVAIMIHPFQMRRNWKLCKINCVNNNRPIG
jgi:hypothetical protein